MRSFSSLRAGQFERTLDDAIRLAEDASSYAKPPDSKLAARLIDETSQIADDIFDLSSDAFAGDPREFSRYQEGAAYAAEVACFAVLASELHNQPLHYAEKALERFQLFTRVRNLPERLPGVAHLFEAFQKYGWHDNSPVSKYVFEP